MKKVLFFFFFLTAWSLYSEAQVANEDKHRLIVTTDLGGTDPDDIQSMMERMLKLDSNFKKGITISFRNSTILVAIPDSKNRFEADVWSSLSDMSILKSDFAVLQSLLEIVDELNLNTRIWSKE